MFASLRVITFVTAVVVAGCAGTTTFAPAEITPEEVGEQIAGKFCQREYTSYRKVLGREVAENTTTDVKFMRIGNRVYATNMEQRAPNGNVIFREFANHEVNIPSQSGGEVSFSARNWTYRLRLAKQGNSIRLLGDVSKGVEKYDADFECPP